jgi:predicted acylesterase/phospholipase RssA
MSAPTRPRTRGDRPRVALVLSGGGARGAYEAGVMRYIREDLAGDLGGQVQFDIICGTSVGAIHACFFAATSDIADKQGRILVDRWESFVLEEMVSFGVKEFMRAPATILGSGHIEEASGGWAASSRPASSSASCGGSSPGRTSAPTSAPVTWKRWR